MFARHVAVSLVLAASGFLAGPVTAQAQQIGVAAAVVNNVVGVQGGVSGPLSIGDDVFAEQVVRTAPASTAQLLFLDQTNLTLGPEAEITLDRFVFDPNRGAGNVVMEATRGAFRFITGTQAPTNYAIQTPVATIGVMGTIAEFLVRNDGGLLLVNSHGVVTATLPNGDILVLTDPGTGYLIQPGGKVEGPFPWPVSLDFLGGNLPLIRFAEIEDFDDFMEVLNALNEQHAQDIPFEPPLDPCEEGYEGPLECP